MNIQGTTQYLQLTTRDWVLHLFQDMSNEPGGRLNKKDGLTRYGDSHVKDKTS